MPFCIGQVLDLNIFRLTPDLVIDTIDVDEKIPDGTGASLIDGNDIEIVARDCHIERLAKAGMVLTLCQHTLHPGYGAVVNLVPGLPAP